MSLVQEVDVDPEIKHRPANDHWKAATIVEFADGVQLFRYEDGSYKLARKDSFIVVEEVVNRKPGAQRGIGSATVFFAPVNPN